MMSGNFQFVVTKITNGWVVAFEGKIIYAQTIEDVYKIMLEHAGEVKLVN